MVSDGYDIARDAIVPRVERLLDATQSHTLPEMLAGRHT